MEQAVTEAVLSGLKAPGRRTRQEAAHQVALLAESDAASLVPYVDVLVDGLARPEAQTRWELLNALAAVAAVDAEAAAGAAEEAESALFDEDSSMVRLAAFRYIAQEGASSPARSAELWPLLDEAVQVYHGDVEFRDMLAALLVFAQGDLAPEVRDALVERVSFDAEKSSMPFIKSYSEQIVAAAQA